MQMLRRVWMRVKTFVRCYYLAVRIDLNYILLKCTDEIRYAKKNMWLRYELYHLAEQNGFKRLKNFADWKIQDI